ncbi:MAG: cell division protein ZapA [Rikenellaceae bacterium]
MTQEEITITIAKTSVNMKVEESKVELYRLAEQTLNNSIRKFEKMNYVGLGASSAIALAAFEFVIANITMRQRNEVDSDEVIALKAIESRIESYMNDLRNEKINE